VLLDYCDPCFITLSSNVSLFAVAATCLSFSYCFTTNVTCIQGLSTGATTITPLIIASQDLERKLHLYFQEGNIGIRVFLPTPSWHKYAPQVKYHALWKVAPLVLHLCRDCIHTRHHRWLVGPGDCCQYLESKGSSQAYPTFCHEHFSGIVFRRILCLLLVIFFSFSSSIWSARLTSPLMTARIGNLVITPSTRVKLLASSPAGLRNKCWSPPPDDHKFIKRLWITGKEVFWTWIANPVEIVLERGVVGIVQAVENVTAATNTVAIEFNMLSTWSVKQ